MSVSQEEFDENWNKVFGGILWFHQCGNDIISTEKDMPCKRCHLTEEDYDKSKSL